eukprot:TRINITY_DN10153_c1_g1_i1.p1 TRINITY_DN10153_c1_g1~~TRINITY_DN10153_c1_g1_i1.p1  ORF type:complete len:103 (-),score=2.43 TRINITY_DN10153_c1_g1_i1:204-512(-)
MFKNMMVKLEISFSYCFLLFIDHPISCSTMHQTQFFLSLNAPNTRGLSLHQGRKKKAGSNDIYNFFVTNWILRPSVSFYTFPGELGVNFQHSSASPYPARHH